MELTTFAFNTVALAFILVAVYDFLAPIYCTATNTVVSPQEWAVAFADIEDEDVEAAGNPVRCLRDALPQASLNPYLDLPLEELFTLSDEIGNKYLEASDHYIATIDWIQRLVLGGDLQARKPPFGPIEDIGESIVAQYLEIDIIGLAKFQSLRLAKHYKLRGEDVVRIEDIYFPIADSIRRYKLRGMEVIKLSAIDAHLK